MSGLDQPVRKELPRWIQATLGALVCLALVAAVLWVYLPMESFDDKQLIGVDYTVLHKYRIEYAREALLGGEPHLPGWYSREMMGTPFWSNVQNFPFIPTRILLLFCPSDVAYQLAIVLAALLSAAFTYLCCRSFRIGRLGAAIAGWSFACSGFFASRVLAGHLPLLEAYPALPLLLWLAETAIQREEARRPYRLRLLAMGLATLAVSLAGHPQLPIYAIAVTACYLLYRDFSRRAVKRLAVLILGGSAAAFVLWPMSLLVRQSTRLLDLDVPLNDVTFPFERLKAFVLPWADGWPLAAVKRLPADAFSGYPSVGYFWDTVCYVGVLPVAAAVVLLAVATARKCAGRRVPHRPWSFFAVCGAVALLTALPPLQSLLHQIPGTILRSPARQTYITIFCLSLGFGALTNLLLTWRPASSKWGLVLGALAVACIGVQLYDLREHDRWFVRFGARERSDPALYRAVEEAVGEGRIAADRAAVPAINRKFDDVGFFDSAMLANPYRVEMSLSGQRPETNVQAWDGRRMNTRALSYLGARLLFTKAKVRGAKRYPLRAGLPVYEIPSPSPRAAFFPLAAVRLFKPDKIHRVLRNQRVDIARLVMLPPDAKPKGFGRDPTDGRGSGIEGTVIYRRDDSDRIRCTVNAPREGYLRVLESWHPGWEARVGGSAAEIVLADDFAMAIHLPPGRHEVTLEYATPGKWAGFAVSLASLALMVLLIASALCDVGRRTDT